MLPLNIITDVLFPQLAQVTIVIKNHLTLWFFFRVLFLFSDLTYINRFTFYANYVPRDVNDCLVIRSCDENAATDGMCLVRMMWVIKCNVERKLKVK